MGAVCVRAFGKNPSVLPLILIFRHSVRFCFKFAASDIRIRSKAFGGFGVFDLLQAIDLY